MPKLPIGDISPCVVIWDYGGAGVMHIGPYLGTVSLRATDSVSDVQEEGYGDAPVDAVFAGTVFELDIPMARSTLVQLDHMLTYEKLVVPGHPLLVELEKFSHSKIWPAVICICTPSK